MTLGIPTAEKTLQIKLGKSGSLEGVQAIAARFGVEANPGVTKGTVRITYEGAAPEGLGVALDEAGYEERLEI